MDHAFRPGDRAIIDVDRWDDLAEAVSPGQCVCCGMAFPRTQSWRMTYRPEDSEEEQLVVCPTCARRLYPRRLTIDLNRLSSVASDSTEPYLLHVKRRVDWIVERRGANGSAIELRAADAVGLAERSGMPVAELANRLHDEGVVVGI